ncbi:MAG: hypothetical protein AAF402_05520 [Pseudomonadota bacterium]
MIKVESTSALLVPFLTLRKKVVSAVAVTEEWNVRLPEMVTAWAVPVAKPARAPNKMTIFLREQTRAIIITPHFIIKFCRQFNKLKMKKVTNRESSDLSERSDDDKVNFCIVKTISPIFDKGIVILSIAFIYSFYISI